MTSGVRRSWWWVSTAAARSIMGSGMAASSLRVRPAYGRGGSRSAPGSGVIVVADALAHRGRTAGVDAEEVIVGPTRHFVGGREPERQAVAVVAPAPPVHYGGDHAGLREGCSRYRWRVRSRTRVNGPSSQTWQNRAGRPARRTSRVRGPRVPSSMRPSSPWAGVGDMRVPFIGLGDVDPAHDGTEHVVVVAAGGFVKIGRALCRKRVKNTRVRHKVQNDRRPEVKNVRRK